MAKGRVINTKNEGTIVSLFRRGKRNSCLERKLSVTNRNPNKNVNTEKTKSKPRQKLRVKLIKLKIDDYPTLNLSIIKPKNRMKLN